MVETGLIIYLVIGSITASPFIYSMLFANKYQRNLFSKLFQREQTFLVEFGKDSLQTTKNPIPQRPIHSSGMVMANITIGPSWWQMWLAQIYTIFGGNIKVFDQLLAYARQEVMQRLREQAQADGWDDVLNVRIETSAIMQKTGGSKNNKTGTMELFAYGTGIK